VARHPGRRIQKGMVLNPLGGKAHNPVIRELRKITQDDVALVGQLIIENNTEEMERIVASPDSTVLQAWMASVAKKGIERGDSNALDVLLNRIIGKAKERVDVNVTRFDQMSNEDIVIEIKKKLEQIE
jgi:hypothetical protein